MINYKSNPCINKNKYKIILFLYSKIHFLYILILGMKHNLNKYAFERFCEIYPYRFPFLASSFLLNRITRSNVTPC